jgi:uncharacterized NAD-dependent epimerase/dehydratase family protein
MSPLAHPANPPRVPSLPPQQWLGPDDKVAVLAHGKWGLWSAKTGVQVLRFSPSRVVAVIDRDRVGQDAAALVDMPEKGPVPIHESLEVLLDAADASVTRLVIGVAPIGGGLPQEVRRDVETAIVNKIPVISGMHALLQDDEALARLAREHGTPLVDLRRPPADPVVTTGAGRGIDVPVVTTVGSDCNSGKMTTSVALREAAREAGIDAAFVATGQTGMLMGPAAGAPIDALISDFTAGEVERQVLRAARVDEAGERTSDSPGLIIVEGQGGLSHPAYACVAGAVLHGSWPDCLVLCHPHGRQEKYFPFQGAPVPVRSPAEEMALIEAFMRPVWPGRVAAVALSAPHLDDETYQRDAQQIREETGLVVADVVRETAMPILEAVLEEFGKRRTPRTKRMKGLPGRKF